ncbi:MAG: hypothetical protein ACYTEW_23220, partial [Planctomycetota bacterium]
RLMCALGQKTQELVALAKDGDKSALNRLYRVYSERVRWVVRFRMSKELPSKLESVDVVQVSYAKIGMKAKTFESRVLKWNIAL